VRFGPGCMCFVTFLGAPCSFFVLADGTNEILCRCVCFSSSGFASPPNTSHDFLWFWAVWDQGGSLAMGEGDRCSCKSSESISVLVIVAIGNSVGAVDVVTGVVVVIVVVVVVVVVDRVTCIATGIAASGCFELVDEFGVVSFLFDSKAVDCAKIPCDVLFSGFSVVLLV
jgi:hypothetical protein